MIPINLFKLLFSISLFTFIGCASIADDFDLDSILTNKNASCLSKLDELDGLAKKILVMDGNNILPRNLTLREEWCTPLKKAAKVGRESVKCTRPFIGQIINVLVNGIKKPVKYICKGPAERSIKNYQCMDDSFVEQILETESKLMDALYTIGNKSLPKDFVLPGLCCTIYQSMDEIKQFKYKECADKSANPSKFLYYRVEETLRDVLDLICGPFSSTAICKEKKPEVLEYLKTQQKGKRDLSKEQFVLSVLKAVSGLASQEDQA